MTLSFVETFHAAFYTLSPPATSVVCHHCRVWHPVHLFRMVGQVCPPVLPALLALSGVPRLFTTLG